MITFKLGEPLCQIHSSINDPTRKEVEQQLANWKASQKEVVAQTDSILTS